ncbi:hypothetical protein CsatB_023299 [Cannabis sativa]
MGSGKAPGPDGMSALFYKHYWEVVGNDFCEAIQDFFISCRMHKGFNDTNIVLIPKIQNPKRTNHFRPISLRNVTYKCYDTLVQFCNWVDQCITTTTLNVCLNGGQVGKIKPLCGLRQGDPLSPYLFICAAEMLSYVLNEALEKWVIKGIRLSNKGPTLTHIFLRMTSFWLGGLMLMKLGECGTVWMSFGWKVKSLSKAGQTTLIKSVGLAMPCYAMQTTKLSNHLMHKIDGMVRDFWWGFEKGNQGMHLKAWDKLCLPKSRGGLGFRKTKEMNLAFLAKWGWNLLIGCQSLCCKILEAKYLRGKDFLSCQYKDSDSWFWKNVVKSKTILRKGACKVIGDGKNTRIWDDPWIPHGRDFIPRARADG